MNNTQQNAADKCVWLALVSYKNEAVFLRNEAVNHR